MKRTKNCVLGAATLSALLLVGAQSFAEDTRGGTAATESGSDGGYGYRFKDDPLSAGGFGASDVTIRVRPRAVRSTLIQPRTSFVPDLLKSVENI